MYITNQQDLDAFIARAKASAVLAIDTEFLREKTYYAKLCLLQMATESETVTVDPFEVRDLHALQELFTDEHIVKLFHAGGQDLEILLREVGVLPAPIFDTQLAAALLGHTQQLGYAALVQAECGVSLKKADSYTDWSRRPLSDSQLKYADDDVIYLPRMYASMRAKLEEKGRLSWLENDFAELIDPAKYEVDERERFWRLKRVGQLSRRQLAAAREFAAWRETEAQRHDIPRKWVVTDEQIVEACRREARTIDELYMVRGLKEKLSVPAARKVVALIAKGLDLPPEEWPEPTHYSKSERNVDVELDLMTALVRLRAKENGVAMQTLASHSDLAAVARGYTEGIDLMRGWRRKLVGEELLELLAGRLELSLHKGALVVERVPG